MSVEPRSLGAKRCGAGPSRICQKADDLESIRGAVDDAAAVGGALWFSYMFVLFYLAVATGPGGDARRSFLENPFKLPGEIEPSGRAIMQGNFA
jgi:hypothetical protein